MSSTHTPGKLVLGRYGAIVGGRDFEFANGSGQKQLFMTCVVPEGVDGDQAANARRLAACWNFCEGVETEAIEEGAANLATLFEGMKAGADSVTAWRQRAQQAVDALAQVETYLQARVDPNGPSTAATKILPMIRKAIEGSGVAPTQPSWSDCGEV